MCKLVWKAFFVLLVAGMSLPAKAQDVHEDLSVYSTASGSGALAVLPDPGLNQVFKNESICFSEACLFSTVNPGVITPTAPGGGYFGLVSGTTISMEIIELDPGVSVKVGAVTLDAAGDVGELGAAPSVHIHPSYQVVVPEDEVGQYSLRFRFVADTGYQPSPTYEMLLSNQPTATPTPTPVPTPTPDSNDLASPKCGEVAQCWGDENCSAEQRSYYDGVMVGSTESFANIICFVGGHNCGCFQKLISPDYYPEQTMWQDEIFQVVEGCVAAGNSHWGLSGISFAAAMEVCP